MNSISPQMLDLLAGNVTLVKTPAGPEGSEGGAGLRRLVDIAMRRRRVLIGSVAVGALLGVLVTLVTPRQYASTARLQIARETAQVVNVGALSRDVPTGDQEFYQTQYGLLHGQALAVRVARDIGVIDDPSFFRMFDRTKGFADNPGPAGRAKRNEIAGDILLKRVLVAPVHSSSLVDVQASTPSPELSQRIAQTWGLDFIASNLDRRLGAAAYAGQFLESRLAQLRDKLEASERRAAAYAASHGIIDMPSTADSGKSTSDLAPGRSLVTDDLSALNAALDGATAERIQAGSQLAVASAQPEASGAALSYRAIGRLHEDRARVASEYAKLTAQTGPDDPAAKAARVQLDSLDTALQGEGNRIRTALQQAYQGAASREQALSKRVNALKGLLARQRQEAVEYNIYRRDADTNRELYEALLQRYKEIGVAGAAENNNVAVIDPARLPDRPASPRMSVNLLLFTLAGAILGVIVAAVLEQLGGRATAAGGEVARSSTALSEP